MLFITFLLFYLDNKVGQLDSSQNPSIAGKNQIPKIVYLKFIFSEFFILDSLKQFYTAGRVSNRILPFIEQFFYFQPRRDFKNKIDLNTKPV